MLRKLSVLGTAAVCVATGLPLASGSPAAAGTAFGCHYPQVCLYQSGSDWEDRHPTASYRRMTSQWQRLGAGGRHSHAVYNSRNDDAVWLLDQDGTSACVKPGDTWFYDETDYPWHIVGIRIVDEPGCVAG
ncbi:hypothetical protein [Actinoplanes sp. NPDC049802]|uniref:hypothetical protein n=1 Tax=Actinoplanes sp. NPDC049802 TaxID=3154742 RepID=UPI0033C5F1EE